MSNAVVSGVLRSPFHRVLSGAVALVRYRGRSSGREFSTPVQYAEHDGAVLIMAGRAETKTWWRNFESDRDLEFLLRGRWVPMRARAVVGSREPDRVASLLDAYLTRFPKATRSLGDDATARVQRAVIVECRPR